MTLYIVYSKILHRGPLTLISSLLLSSDPTNALSLYKKVKVKGMIGT